MIRHPDGTIIYTEVEVQAEHGDVFVTHITGALGPVPDWARYYRHTFSDRQPLTADTARALGVPVDADPETAARVLATSPGFVRSVKPGTTQLRRRTVTVSPWKQIQLPTPNDDA